MLADRVGLTTAFRDVLARSGFVPGRDRGRAVTDTVAALAAGASCLRDVEAMTAQVELFGPSGGASETTVLRVLGEYADRLGGDGLPGRRLAQAIAKARAGAWEAVVARHGRLPVVQVRYVRHARSRILKIPTGWAWATHLADAFPRLRALHPA